MFKDTTSDTFCGVIILNRRTGIIVYIVLIFLKYYKLTHDFKFLKTDFNIKMILEYNKFLLKH